MLIALSAKNKVEFVNGTTSTPPLFDPLRNASQSCNNMVVFWIVHYVSIPIHHSILWLDNAEDIWKDLKS